MKKFFIILLSFFMSAAFADVKLSELPLGNAASTVSLDSFPYASNTTKVTRRLNLWYIANTPALAAKYAPLLNPSFTGTIATPMPPDFAMVTTLASNDWVAILEYEGGTAMPLEIKQARQAARDRVVR